MKTKEIELLLATYRLSLQEKQKKAATNQLSLIQNRFADLDNFENRYNERIQHPLHDKDVLRAFYMDLLKIGKEISAI